MSAIESLEAPGRVRVTRAEFKLGAPRVDVLGPPTLPEFGLVGRSNVGKSSLLNYLTGRKGLARVSNTPGATRQLNLFGVDLLSGVFKRSIHLVDLPGYGWAQLAKSEKAALSKTLESYIRAPRGIRAVCLLLDIRRDPSADDLRMHDLLMDAQVPTILTVTKVDKIGKAKRKAELSRVARAFGLPVADLAPTSAEEGTGRDEVWSRLWVLLNPKGSA